VTRIQAQRGALPKLPAASVAHSVNSCCGKIIAETASQSQ
jgi:hypothetical protein